MKFDKFLDFNLHAMLLCMIISFWFGAVYVVYKLVTLYL